MATISSAGHRLGSALVAAQFILMGALGWCGEPALLAGRWPEITLTLLGLGVGVGGLALLAVLARKAALEEDWLRTGHPDYEAYSARPARFLPWLY